MIGTLREYHPDMQLAMRTPCIRRYAITCLNTFMNTQGADDRLKERQQNCNFFWFHMNLLEEFLTAVANWNGQVRIFQVDLYHVIASLKQTV